MKRMLAIFFLAAVCLTGCNSSTLSFNEIEQVPDEVKERIGADYRLQLIHKDEKGSYIVFHSDQTVTKKVEAVGDTVSILFDEVSPQKDSMKQYVYYLTREEEHEVIHVLVNGKEMAFDIVTSL